jgi:drug/metabolite transporter (DMT)-like permease
MYQVGGVNYIVAALIGTVWIVVDGRLEYGWSGFVYGSLNGVCYFAAYFFLLYAVRRQGIAATTAVAQLSILIPIVFSIVVWREHPSTAQVVGLLIAGGSLALLDQKGGTVRPMSAMIRWVLLGFLLLAGAARLAAKAFAELQVPAQKPFYVAMLFVVTALASFVMLGIRRRLPTRAELLWGSLAGFCNVVQMAFFLMALERLPGIVVFPISATGTLVTTAVLAVLIFEERPTMKLYAGIAASTVAVFLLNWQIPR